MTIDDLEADIAEYRRMLERACTKEDDIRAELKNYRVSLMREHRAEILEALQQSDRTLH